MVWTSAPEVAVTTTEYVPAGVPDKEPPCCEEAPPELPLQATKQAAVTNNNASTNCGASLSERFFEAHRTIAQKANASPEKYISGVARNVQCRIPPVGANDRAVVEIERFTLVGFAPGVTVGEEKEAEAPAGKPVTVKFTGLINAPLEGAMLRV